jgi:hypothetical protein
MVSFRHVGGQKILLSECVKIHLANFKNTNLPYDKMHLKKAIIETADFESNFSLGITVLKVNFVAKVCLYFELYSTDT